MGEGVGKTERIAGAAVEVDEPFEGFDAARHTAGQLVLQAADDFMFAAVDHGDANLANDGHGAVALTRFEKGLDDFLRWAKIFAVGSQYAEREGRSFIPICVF